MQACRENTSKWIMKTKEGKFTSEHKLAMRGRSGHTHTQGCCFASINRMLVQIVDVQGRTGGSSCRAIGALLLQSGHATMTLQLES